MSMGACAFNDDDAFVVRSPLMLKLLALVRKVASSSAAVLITGETGVGKEFIAQSIHRHSLRARHPWVDINCAALPEHLVESELFGYEKGAFSGADSSKPGLFELANKGTLFLDEIGDLDPKIQVKLLRVLDGAPFFRLGGKQKVSTTARIVAATNHSLEDAVQAGTFRRDLFHRLAQFQLQVPPLRERLEEILPLVEHFLAAEKLTLTVSPAAAEILQAYSWPGNVRELRNVVLQASARAENGEIGPDDLPAELLETADRPETSASAPDISGLDAVERQAIRRALERTGGHQGMAAEQLGISRRTLSRKLRSYRQEDGQPGDFPRLGVLSPEQQTSYRTTVQVPVEVRTSAGIAIPAVSVNLSEGGMQVAGIDSPLRVAGTVNLSFAIPGGPAIQARGRTVWAEPAGRIGIQFLDMQHGERDALRAWLQRLQADEGWAPPDKDSDPAYN
jgi:DNA-binding NtrC family response regulator